MLNQIQIVTIHSLESLLRIHRMYHIYDERYADFQNE